MEVLTKLLISKCYLIRRVFLVNVSVQYLTFKTSYAKFLVKACIVEYCTYNNEQFGGYLIKIKEILRILQGFPLIS